MTFSEMMVYFCFKIVLKHNWYVIMLKRVSIIGSTGSIGRSSLEVIDHLNDQFKVSVLAAHSNIDLLEKQARKFGPDLVAVYNEERAEELRKRLVDIPVLSGESGIIEAASYSDTDIVISAAVGAAGLRPTLAAIEAGKDIALANKEVLVCAGELVTAKAREKGVKLLPVDSEHSAIFQCLQGCGDNGISRLLLTSSGGPFRNYDMDQLSTVKAADALKHPTWQMGAKITIDSSTLMNKGLEVIEAYWLFGVPLDKIEVVVHPQSIVHSMVEFEDRSILAQLGYPSMKLPIQYALTYPDRLEGPVKQFDFTKASTLEFFPPDAEKFRCLSLAYEALRTGGSLPCYMNAANEVLVNRFLGGEISWTAIPQTLESLMERHDVVADMTLEAILEIDRTARLEAKTHK